VNAIQLPSGDQVGWPSWRLLFVSRRWFEPSAFINQISFVGVTGLVARLLS
jgi:hypothetical protein